jgi:ribose/xylose/arabinose/galactoside ABC-type transport system permease subunit
MPEQIGRTQGLEKYCRKVCIWILQTWNTEIPWIIELPVVFSVAKAVAGAKNGICVQRCKVLSIK